MVGLRTPNPPIRVRILAHLPTMEIKMKKATTITIILGMITHAMFFWGGIVFERTASNQAIEEIMQVAQEACDMRIKTLKATCK